MSKISVLKIDTAGQTIVSNIVNCNVFINGSIVALKGAKVGSNHKMIESSNTIFVNGIGVVRKGDKASNGSAATGVYNISAS